MKYEELFKINLHENTRGHVTDKISRYYVTNIPQYKRFSVSMG